MLCFVEGQHGTDGAHLGSRSVGADGSKGPMCSLGYQLKSRKTALKNRVVDAGYEAMIRAIRSEQVPNLFLLQYASSWSVVNLLLVPSFFSLNQRLRNASL